MGMIVQNTAYTPWHHLAFVGGPWKAEVFRPYIEDNVAEVGRGMAFRRYDHSDKFLIDAFFALFSTGDWGKNCVGWFALVSCFRRVR